MALVFGATFEWLGLGASRSPGNYHSKWGMVIRTGYGAVRGDRHDQYGSEVQITVNICSFSASFPHLLSALLVDVMSGGDRSSLM